MWIGLLGYDCAHATPAVTSIPIPTITALFNKEFKWNLWLFMKISKLAEVDPESETNLMPV